jgi:hypothetical protein
VDKPGTRAPGISRGICDTDVKKEINKQGRKKKQSNDGVQPEENLLVTGFFGKQTPQRMEESGEQN